MGIPCCFLYLICGHVTSDICIAHHKTGYYIFGSDGQHRDKRTMGNLQVFVIRVQRIRDLTWYDLKQVPSWFVWISCEFIDQASLQWYTALKRTGRSFQIVSHHRSIDLLCLFSTFTSFSTFYLYFTVTFQKTG